MFQYCVTWAFAVHLSGSSFQRLTPGVLKSCASYGRSHYQATEMFLMTCLTCRHIGDVQCFLLWVFIAKPETNIFFIAAVLGGGKGFWMDTCNTKQTTAEQVSHWHTVRPKLVPSGQLKGCCCISSTQALFPTLPTTTMLCSTPHHEQQSRAESPRKGKNFYSLEVRSLSEPVSIHRTEKNHWAWYFGRNVAFSVNHSFKTEALV